MSIAGTATAGSAGDPREAQPEAPCRTCGACCATAADWPRFSTETEEELAQIPDRLVAASLSGMACEGDRCLALAGVVGEATACTIYPVRPHVCRACEPGDEACQHARRQHGLAPL